MAANEYLINGRTREAMIEDVRSRGIRGRLVILAWPPLHNSDAWERLRALSASEDTTFVARVFPDGAPTTKAYDDYIERYFRFVDDATSYDEEQTIHGLSSTMRTCKRCSSHVAVEHVEGESCPVCGADLRSNTVHKTLNRWRERIAKVREQGEGEATKAGWLGSWAALQVEGSALEAPEARRNALRRSYDSEAMTIAGRDEEALYVPRSVLATLTERSEQAGLSPIRYLEELLNHEEAHDA